MNYKIKVIEKMQELGMTISIDKIGNICGSISIGNNPKKTLVIGSHTDSVYDGGQYDGPVGVIVGLQTVEELLNSKNCNGTVKVAIYACEESSRFGNACLGSKFLNGTITEKNFDDIVDQKALEDAIIIPLRTAIDFSKSYLHAHIKDIEEVDKIFDEVDYSLETHIEQYELLKKEYKKNKQDLIGIVNSVGSAVRIKYDVQGKSGHTGSTPMNKRQNAVDAAAFVGIKVRKLGKKYEKEGFGRASQVEISTPGHNGSFNQIPSLAQGMIDFRLLGENNPDRVLKDFQAILEKVEKKTKTKITPSTVSKGAPVITSKSLNTEIANVCSKEGINFIEMPS
ncbi:MAG: M20/M25/M40 family metallo-hydrolase, partial [Bacilli bacterium]|nr:M20/M25/M40 family metallo-hydrolase [Bacilli bacterium]